MSKKKLSQMKGFDDFSNALAKSCERTASRVSRGAKVKLKIKIKRKVK